MAVIDVHQCQAEVWERPGYFHSHQCERRATKQVDDVWYCTAHAKAIIRHNSNSISKGEPK